MRKLAIPAGIGLLFASYFFGSEVLGNRLPQPAEAQAREALPPLVLPAGNSPEAQLTEVFARIEQNRLDLALQQAEALTARYPNFRLGQLVKGDLLLARAQPISSFGNAANAPQEKLADLLRRALAAHQQQGLVARRCRARAHRAAVAVDQDEIARPTLPDRHRDPFAQGDMQRIGKTALDRRVLDPVDLLQPAAQGAEVHCQQHITARDRIAGADRQVDDAA